MTGLVHLHNVFKVHPCCRMCQNFLPFYLRLNHTPLYVSTAFCVSIRLLMDTWVASTFWLLWVMLLRTQVYKSWFAFNKEKSSRSDGMSVPCKITEDPASVFLTVSLPLRQQLPCCEACVRGNSSQMPVRNRGLQQPQGWARNWPLPWSNLELSAAQEILRL